MIKELHIEASSACQAGCVMCTRTGMKDLVPTSLKFDWFRDDLQWFTNNIDLMSLEKIMFCGNLGDPASNHHLLSICRYIKTQNPYIVLGINTNGALQNPEWWRSMGRALSDIQDYVVFSLDGTVMTNHIYRKDVLFTKAMNNAGAFIDAGGSAHWDMLVFDHNSHEVEECKQMAKEVGFSWFRTKESARWDVYPPGTDGLYPVDDSWMDITTTPIECEANNDSSRYIDANGLQWPCCHMAEAMHLPGNDDIRKFNNTELLDNYNSRLNTMPYSICKKACGTTARKGQWRQEINLKEIT